MSLHPMFVSNVDDALKTIDFEVPDDDRANFYTFVFIHKYNIKMNYDSPEYRPPKYFKLLLKLIEGHMV